MKRCSYLCVTDKPKDSEYRKLFFGKTGGVRRQDKVFNSNIADKFDYGFSKVWHWKAIDFENDSKGFYELPENIQRIFLLNNGYQTIMDSGVENGYLFLTSIVSNNALRSAYYYIGQNEDIHANSYSYGLLGMFKSEAESKLDIVYQDPVVSKRLESEVGDGTDMIDEICKYHITDIITSELKESIVKYLVDTLIIEDIKFPFSFFTTFSINATYNNAINGFTNLLKMITRDELELHVPINVIVVGELLRSKIHGFTTIFDDDMMQWIEKRINDAELDEKDWATYLLQDGAFPGFNKEVCDIFIEYRSDLVRSIFKIPKKYKHSIKSYDFLEWFDEYRKIQNQNQTLQEMSNNNYEKGVISRNIDQNLDKLKSMFSDF